MSKLKELRLKNKVSQKFCAEILGVSLRSYKDYENDESKENSIKYNYLFETLSKYFELSENKGILTKENIINICQPIFEKFKVDYCYLFGSYSKGTANETSDVDLLISSSCGGLKFFELAEQLRENLNKKIDLLDVKQLNNNKELLDEILKSGVKIYG